MGKINWSRVVVAGLLAGLVLNVIDFVVYGMWLKPDFAAALQALGKQPPGGSTILLYVVLDFVYGVGLLWLYAAIRPRFGAGAKTAVVAGLALWFFTRLLHALGEVSMGFLPERLYTLDVIVGLIELPLAGAIGAYLYQEA
jgi:hypothetical protein